MSWSEFSCEDPNFTVRSMPDGTTFQVKREYLEKNSDVFRDMFSCCDSGNVVYMLDSDVGSLDLGETAATLNLLFTLLHTPPGPYLEPEPPKVQRDFTWVLQSVLPTSAIPFPLLPTLLSLADKYALSKEIQDNLITHLGAYVSTHPLPVYGHAVELGLHDVAAKASAFLLDPPLSTYSPKDISVIPTAAAYHKLVLLHDYRIKKLTLILMGESIFPHGYGKCHRHGQKTESIWDERKKVVVDKIQAATDVAAMMCEVQPQLGDCDICTRACVAAVSMLAYKCAKVPRRIDKLPEQPPAL